MLFDELETDPKPKVAALEAAYERHRTGATFGRDVCETLASGSPLLERGGAWLLRRHVCAGGAVAAADWEIVLAALPAIRAWEARLELGQLLSAHPELTAADPEGVAAFLRACAADGNPLIRAWGVSAFHALGRRDAAFRTEARRLVAAARKDPAGSVQARLRHLK